MRSHLWVSLIAVLSVAAPIECVRAIADDTANQATRPEQALAGSLVVNARMEAIAAASFKRPLDAKRIRQWMELGSQCTIAEFELFLAPLSEEEIALVKKVEQVPAPIVSRLHFDHLRGVLKNQAIVALEIAEEARHRQLQHTTPAVENDLYGAYDCAFASVGPPNGSPRYGDVIIRLQDSVREHGWATPFSGMHFLSVIRGKPAAEMQDLLASGHSLPVEATNPLSLGFDDRLHFSHYIVTERAWNKALAYQAVLVLRNLDDSEASNRVRQRLTSMLAEQDPEEFWNLFIPPRLSGLSPEDEAGRVPFGYLEAKFPGKVPISYFTSIEVPPDRLSEVRTWPESKSYRQLIRAKPSGVDE